MIDSKTLHKIAAEYILEKNININIEGSEEFITSYSRVLSESKKLYDEVNRKDFIYEAIVEAAKDKKKASLILLPPVKSPSLSICLMAPV